MRSGCLRGEPRSEPARRYGDHPGEPLNGVVSIIYLRLAWSYLEPEEGNFNWSFVDIPAQRWIAKRIAFRFSCDENPGQWPAVPDWVRKAGGPGYYSRQDARGITPVWRPLGWIRPGAIQSFSSQPSRKRGRTHRSASGLLGMRRFLASHSSLPGTCRAMATSASHSA